MGAARLLICDAVTGCLLLWPLGCTRRMLHASVRAHNECSLQAWRVSLAGASNRSALVQGGASEVVVSCMFFHLVCHAATRPPRMQDTATPGGLYSTVRLKLGLFGAELLKCCAQQIRTKSAKVGDGRPARSWAPGSLYIKRSSHLRPSKAAKAGARWAPQVRGPSRAAPA